MANHLIGILFSDRRPRQAEDVLKSLRDLAGLLKSAREEAALPRESPSMYR